MRGPAASRLLLGLVVVIGGCGGSAYDKAIGGGDAGIVGPGVDAAGSVTDGAVADARPGTDGGIGPDDATGGPDSGVTPPADAGVEPRPCAVALRPVGATSMQRLLAGTGAISVIRAEVVGDQAGAARSWSWSVSYQGAPA